MIDILDQVFAIVETAAKTVSSEVSVRDPYIGSPATFPCVTVQEADNVTTPYVIGTRATEHYARIVYQIEVFSNKTDVARSECREITNRISDALISRGFNRIIMTSTPNYLDASIYRITTRFQAIVDDKNNIYRR